MSWQDEFRQWFPITRDKAYANIAYTSPLSSRVSGAVAAFFDGIAQARSDKLRWPRDANALRSRLARLIGGEARQHCGVWLRAPARRRLQQPSASCAPRAGSRPERTLERISWRDT